MEVLGIETKLVYTDSGWVDVLLRVPGTEREIVVGSLCRADERFTFHYIPEFITQNDVPPISAFPEKERLYEACVLFPFFAVRLPPLEREDVKQRMLESGVEPTETLRLLGELAAQTPASPYILRFHAEDGTVKP